MTEEEAKTKWCPFSRDKHGNRSAYSDEPVQEIDPDYVADMAGAYPCIGSACMAWRVLPPNDNWVLRFRDYMVADMWINAIKEHRAGTGSNLKDAKDYVDAIRGGTKPLPEPSIGRSGYCGLAGKP